MPTDFQKALTMTMTIAREEWVWKPPSVPDDPQWQQKADEILSRYYPDGRLFEAEANSDCEVVSGVGS